MKTFTVWILVSLLFAGCASQVWYQPGKTPAQAYQDLTDCKSKARAAVDPSGIASVLMWPIGIGIGVYTEECMQSRGWVLTPARSVTNASQYPKP